jgi:hypothetical protein
MAAFLIEAAGEGEDAPGVELDAVSATFATLNDDVDNPFADLDRLRIQRRAPEFHVPLPVSVGVQGVRPQLRGGVRPGARQKMISDIAFHHPRQMVFTVRGGWP